MCTCLQLSYADVVVFAIMEILSNAHPDFDRVIKTYSKITALCERIGRIPSVAKYIERRQHAIFLKVSDWNSMIDKHG